VTQQQRDDLRGAARTIDRIARDAAKLRDNPDHRKGNARRTDLRSGLALLEAALQSMAAALRDMADQDTGA